MLSAVFITASVRSGEGSAGDPLEDPSATIASIELTSRTTGFRGEKLPLEGPEADEVVLECVTL
eukprot:CAMPEP_0176437004 /NCGR_PEP_ID=MMETSP0127-20121128/18349_1 /TAXON_ID=938130 /ORGANISM="Platyophrya macrostoma, Strain WH" /LENGTH=63 /DNA_ID=CAMNT_0017820519 /DNA_START=578 /DNA_END=769 /DNA_ORIENTATION=-